MELFIRVRQGLTAIEALFRRVARRVGLRPQEAWVLALAAAAGERVTGTWLARETGRARQQVQRSLQGLQARGLVVPVEGRDGRANGWVLTARGKQIASAMEVTTELWMEGVGRQVDVEALARTLERVVANLFARRSGEGWRRGLWQAYSPRTDEVELVVASLLEGDAS